MRRKCCLISTAVLISTVLTAAADEPPRTTPTPTPDSRSASAVRLEAGANGGPVKESARREFDARPQTPRLEWMTVERPPLPQPRSAPFVRPVFPGNPETPHTTGAKSIPTPPAGSIGVTAEADGAGGIFRDTDSDAEAWLGTDGIGIRAYGSTGGADIRNSVGSGFALIGALDTGIHCSGHDMGGTFSDTNSSGWAFIAAGDTGVIAGGSSAGGRFSASDATGYAWVGHGDAGIEAGGDLTGGLFVDSDGSGEAWVGHGDFGIEARGNEMGGYFENSATLSYARVGTQSYGIIANGSDAGGNFFDLALTANALLAHSSKGIVAQGYEMGGYFEDSDGTGFAHLGWGNTGVFGRGNVAGGVFDDEDGSGYARAGYGDRGVDAGGHEMGGHFKDSDGSGYSYVGIGNRGIVAAGNEAGGIFHDLDHSGYSYIGYGDRGIEAFGDEMGGYFEESAGTGVANLAVGNRGIQAFGTNAGGFFENTSTSAWTSVAYDTQKVSGTGTVNFIQNHPYDSSSVIVYTAPEGDEVATYTRGTARLVDGEARVQLGDTFKWVTNPDIGLTAYLTPVGEFCDLYVVEKSTEQIVVRSRDGFDCTFDFLVYGLRVGFEEISPVKEKDQEAYIPSMASHRDLNQHRPDLRELNSLERFKTMARAVSGSDEVDLSRAHALRDAIVEFDPAVHEMPRPARDGRNPGTANTSTRRNDGGKLGEPRSRAGSQESTAAPSHFASAQMIPMDEDGDVYARSFRSSSSDLANWLEVSQPVGTGDVLVMDPQRPGAMRLAVSSSDPTVVGVVAASPGVVLGSEPGVATRATAVAFSGVAACKVDASYGPIYPGDLLVTSPTPGHAQRADVPLPGTVLGKAMEEHTNDTGTIKVLVMLR